MKFTIIVQIKFLKNKINFIALHSTHKKILTFNAFESISIVLAMTLQIYYIKKLFENKIIS